MTDLNASLILKTSDLTSQTNYTANTAYNNQMGSCNAKLSSITWNNINLRTILGDMYDKYDSFNLCLNTISTAQANAIDSSADSRNVIVKLYGLPWKNQTYNVSSGANTSGTVITTFNFVPFGATTQYYYSSNIATFTKNQDIVNLTVDYSRILDNTTPTSTSTTSISGLTATASSGSNTITLSASNSGIGVGTIVSATGIPVNSTVTAVSGQNITISNNTTQALAAATILFQNNNSYPNVCIIFDIFGIDKDEGNKNATRINLVK